MIIISVVCSLNIYQKNYCWDAEESVIADGDKEGDFGRGRVADPVEGPDGDGEGGDEEDEPPSQGWGCRTSDDFC